ncbi:hypothetical protein FOXYSP1_11609 [Fusarium oxysporum f. sp. phaseoli]
MPPAVEQDKAYLNIQFSFFCSVDFGAGSMVMQSSLGSTSFILSPSCHLTGGFAMASWWDPSPVAGDWVFTVGGYHPQYQVPSHYPVPERLGISWQVDGHVSITGGAYFAMTPNAVMAGANLLIQFSASIVWATLTAWADFLVNLAPFYFIADIGVTVDAGITIGWGWLSFTISAHIGAMLHLEGPPIHGFAEIDVCSHIFTVAIGSGADSLDEAKQPMDFASLCNLLLEQNKGLKDSSYHVLNLQSGGVLAEPGSTESSSTTPWRARAATFAFQVEAVVPISTATVNEQKQSNDEKADSKLGPVNSTDLIYSRPMQLSGDRNLDSSLGISILNSNNTPAQARFRIEPVYSKAPATLWGECKLKSLIFHLGTFKIYCDVSTSLTMK